MLKEYSGLAFSAFDTADMKKNVGGHAYRSHLDAGLLDAQLKANQELLTEVDEFKN
jgi:hypothetical protein